MPDGGRNPGQVFNKSKIMKTKQFAATGKVKEVWYRNTSYVGNNSYYISFETESGVTLTGYTAPNSQLGYTCSNYEFKKFAYMQYNFTKGGKMVIDTICNRSTYEKYYKTENK